MNANTDPLWNREREIFLAALERPSSEERAGFLDGACGNDAPLRARLESLLQNHSDDNFLEEPPRELEAVRRPGPLASENIGAIIGRYKLLQKIGEGGMGVVYMAEQEQPVRRRVALKIIKLGMDTRQVVARFEAERQALAMMDHPNIAKVLDAGATDTGGPYFVMELVQGVPITEFCDKNQLPARERIKLFIQVCQAIQSAHQKGIIHRDLKPTNILVTLNAGVPHPMVIDFGVAKATQQKLTEKTVFTNYATMIGTPAYMSPEQAEMSRLDVDTRSDIYGLGVLLYELLTGTTPFPEKRLRSVGYNEMQRIIMEEEPERPSTRLRQKSSAVSTNHCPLSTDLDWIVMKCLEKDRSRRYETANGLAADIQRHLSSEPVIARPASAAYRLQRMVRRHKLQFAAGGTVLAALVAGLAVSMVSVVQTKKALHRAVEAEAAQTTLRQDAQAAATEAKNALVALYFSEANRRIEAGNASEAVPYLSQILTAAPDNRAALMRLASVLTDYSWMVPDFSLKHGGWVNGGQFSPDGRRIVTASADFTARVWNAETGQAITGPLRHTATVDSVQFSPDGSQVVTASEDKTAQVWDARTGLAFNKPLAHTRSVSSAQFSPDGACIVTASFDSTARLWDAQSGQALGEPLRHANAVFFAQFSPDGKRVVTASADHTARVWDAQTCQPITRPLQHRDIVCYAQFSPDGRRLVTASWDHSAQVWDARTGEALTAPLKHGGQVINVTFSPDGRRIATASRDKTARIWDAQTGELLTPPLQHRRGVSSVQFSPDGKRVVTASEDGAAQVWDAQSGQPLSEPLEHSGPIWSACFSPDGLRILTFSADNTARVWSARTTPPLNAPLKHADRVRTAQFSRDGRRVVTASNDHTARVWDAESCQPVTPPMKHADFVFSAEFSPDGTRVVTASYDHTARVWDAQNGQAITQPLSHGDWVFSAQFSPDGKRVVTASKDKTARVWDAQTGQPVTGPLVHAESVAMARFSPDGSRIVTACWDHVARVWDARTGQLLLQSLVHEKPVACAEFSPDGKRIVTGSADSTARVWDAQTGQPVTGPLRHADYVLWAEFSPDGKRVVTASRDATARLWDAQTGRQLTEPLKHEASVEFAQFSPDGRWALTASLDGTLRLWDAQTGQPLIQPFKHGDKVNTARFSPDGKRVVSASRDKTARLWDVGLAPSSCPDWLLRLAEALSGKRLNKQGIFEQTTLDRAKTVAQIRDYLNRQPDQEDGVRWGRWLLSDPANRTISPFSSMPTTEAKE